MDFLKRDILPNVTTLIVPNGIKLSDSVIEDCKQAGFRPLGVEGADVGEWVLVDLGETVVHVMLPATRAFYDLERLWSLRPGDLAISGGTTEPGADAAGD